MPAKFWNKRRIAVWLRDYVGCGGQMTAAAMRQVCHGVVRAIYSHYGSIAEAAKDACVEYKCDRRWRGKADVIAEFRRLAASGPVTPKRIRSDNGLYHAVYRWFGSFEKAMRGAHLPFERKRPRPKRIKRYKRPRWTRETLREFLRERHRVGLPNTVVAIECDCGSAYNAIRRWFKTLEAAMIDAGLVPERAHEVWSADIVKRKLQMCAARGFEMSTSGIEAEGEDLLAACRRYFKSVEDAVVASGLKPVAQRRGERVGNRRIWTTPSVSRAIIDRLKAGLDMNISAVLADDGPLLTAARDAYGSWNEALIANGVDPATVSREKIGNAWGRVFEQCMRELLWVIRADWKFVVRAGRLIPDMYDAKHDVCIDLKAGAYIDGVDKSILAYAPYCSEMIIIYGRGRPREDEIISLPDGPRSVRFIPWTVFAAEAQTEAALRAAATLERLMKGWGVPDDLRWRRWTAPLGYAKYALRPRSERCAATNHRTPT